MEYLDGLVTKPSDLFVYPVGRLEAIMDSDIFENLKETPVGNVIEAVDVNGSNVSVYGIHIEPLSIIKHSFSNNYKFFIAVTNIQTSVYDIEEIEDGLMLGPFMSLFSGIFSGPSKHEKGESLSLQEWLDKSNDVRKRNYKENFMEKKSYDNMIQYEQMERMDNLRVSQRFFRPNIIRLPSFFYPHKS